MPLINDNNVAAVVFNLFIQLCGHERNARASGGKLTFINLTKQFQSTYN